MEHFQFSHGYVFWDPQGLLAICSPDNPWERSMEGRGQANKVPTMSAYHEITCCGFSCERQSCLCKQCRLWPCPAKTIKLHVEVDPLILAPKMFKHVSVMLCIDFDGLSTVIFKEVRPNYSKRWDSPLESDLQTVQWLLMKVLGIFYGPVMEILSIHCTS